MKDDDIERLFAAMDAAYKPQGFKHFEDGIRWVLAGLREIAEIVAKYEDRDELREKLRRAPEADQQFLQEALQTLPNTIYAFRKTAPDAIKEIPHAPGGRRRLRVHARQQEICQEIGVLIVKGVPLSIAYKRIGQRYGASARTIQRIWNQRKKEN